MMIPTGYILELGEEVTAVVDVSTITSATPELLETRKEWRGAGYYRWYEVKGPIIVANIDDAFVFPTSEKAENVRNGDERLKGARILCVPRTPTESSMMPPIL